MAAASKGRRAFFAIALLAFAAGPGIMRGQTDIEALRARAALGEPEAFNELGNAYANGQGVPRDDTAALSFYQQAADRGFAAAWFNLGMFHELGRGVAQDMAGAFKLYLKSADRGFAPAQFNVGNMYANGLGVTQNFMEAAVWFRQAADHGVPEAQFNLGLAYELGRGVRKDEGLAQLWYKRAASHGNARAQYNLALMLEEGRGVPAVDPVAAMNMYTAAAMQNFAPAQNNLGLLLAEGRGVPVNLVEAFTWLTLAFENGVASNVREMVAQRLSVAALDEANAVLAQLRLRFGLKGPAVVRTASAEPVAAPLASPAKVPDPMVQEVNALKNRMVATESALEKFRAESGRLSELARAAEESRVKVERRLAAVEATVRATIATASVAENPLFTPGNVEEDAGKPAAVDPRIENLMTENARLNEELKQSALEIAQLNAQLRIMQQKEGATAGSGAGESAPVAANDKVAELTHRIEVMRRTIDKLAEESRWHASVGADLSRLRIENEQLKAERQGGR